MPPVDSQPGFPTGTPECFLVLCPLAPLSRSSPLLPRNLSFPVAVSFNLCLSLSFLFFSFRSTHYSRISISLSPRHDALMIYTLQRTASSGGSARSGLKTTTAAGGGPSRTFNLERHPRNVFRSFMCVSARLRIAGETVPGDVVVDTSRTTTM